MSASSSRDSGRRSLILAAAGRLVRHYGFHKTTVADIAREADVGVGTVYLEFKSKDAVVEELARLGHERTLDELRAQMATRKSHAERLKAMLDCRVRCFLDAAESGHHAGELLHCACPAVEAAFHRYQEEEEALFAAVLVSGQRAGEFSLDDPRRAAAILLRAYASFAPPVIFTQPREHVIASVASMHRLVLQGLLKRKRA